MTNRGTFVIKEKGEKKHMAISNTAYLGANVLSGLSGSQGAGGSRNTSASSASSWSNTAGAQASAESARQAELAHQRQLELLKQTQEFNAKEAQKQRDWEKAMAETTYQRSAQDMKAAGINPILAAGMGLGSSSVGSGATASVSTPSTYMGQTYAEQNSAYQSQSHGEGSSWNESSSGLATGLSLLADAISGAIGSLSSSNKIEIALKGLEDLGQKTYTDSSGKKHNYSENYNKPERQLLNETLNEGFKGVKNWLIKDWNKHLEYNRYKK